MDTRPAYTLICMTFTNCLQEPQSQQGLAWKFDEGDKFRIQQTL